MKDCPACGTVTAHRFLYVKNACRLYVCTSCGLGRADAAAFEPESYYTGAYFDGTVPDGYADYGGSEAVLRAEFSRTLAVLRDVVPEGNLLEVGAAYGFFLLEAQAHYRVRGVELAGEAASFARSRGLDVRTGALTAEAFAGLEPVDAVVMLDVIEHLQDPAAAIALSAAHLRPGGAMLITTGDFGSLVARATGRHWRLMTPPQHLWFFSVASLAGIGSRFGLRVARVEHPWKRVPISLIAYQLARMAGFRLSAAQINAIRGFGLPVNLFDAMRVTLQKR